MKTKRPCICAIQLAGLVSIGFFPCAPSPVKAVNDPFIIHGDEAAWSESTLLLADELRNAMERRVLYASDPRNTLAESTMNNHPMLGEYTRAMTRLHEAIDAWSRQIGSVEGQAAYRRVLESLYGEEVDALMALGPSTAGTTAPREYDAAVWRQLASLEMMVLALAPLHHLEDREMMLIAKRAISPQVQLPIRQAHEAAVTVLREVEYQSNAIENYPALELLLESTPVSPRATAEVARQLTHGPEAWRREIQRDVSLLLGESGQGLTLKDQITAIQLRYQHVKTGRKLVHCLGELLAASEHVPVEFERTRKAAEGKIQLATCWMNAMSVMKEMLSVDRHSPVYGDYVSLLGLFNHPAPKEGASLANPAQSSVTIIYPGTETSVRSIPLYDGRDREQLVLESPVLIALKKQEQQIRDEIDFLGKAKIMSDFEHAVSKVILTSENPAAELANRLGSIAQDVMRGLPAPHQEALRKALREWMPSAEVMTEHHLNYFNASSDESRRMVADILLKRAKLRGFDQVYRTVVNNRRREIADFQRSNGGDRAVIIKVDYFNDVPLELLYWQERYLDLQITKSRRADREQYEKALTAQGFGWNGNHLYQPKEVLVANAGLLHPESAKDNLRPEPEAVKTDRAKAEYMASLASLVVARTESEREQGSQLRPGDHPDKYYQKIHEDLKRVVEVLWHRST